MSRSRLTDILCWLGVACVAVALAAYGYTSSSYHHDHAIRADGCLAYVNPPEVLAVADDITDKLTGDQPGRWRATVTEQIAARAPGSVLLFTTIGASVPAEIAFEGAPCAVASGSSSRLRMAREALDRTLTRVEMQLENASTMDRSEIRGTILAIAADRAFAVARRRELLVESDLLENDGKASAYRRKGLLLSPPVGSPLKGVTVHFVVLQNLRDAKFQTPQLIQVWIAWAKSAGAKVVVDAPWLGYVPSGQPGAQS